ncbi:glycine betaine ABC transporter substrate-binding protein [Salipaludibacillus sp. CUR1]|uniref:glycine betaine ABC transporter substrate-binding protein n=1 Tax=Salipaludibacillus sp. CUR1 TaxID=2820003 RepID=UPI001E5F59F1|nr:glycine betaine ABC transporter substrate-binding protein [Salipaludibacillus sp. CUR1]MCE7792769.1 glycine betaine ABC transporter substrate-binding protein [Salipaludibacillus sp. CUR1]
MNKSKLLMGGLLSSALVLAACGDDNGTNVNEDNNNDGNNEAADTAGGEIEIGLNNWAENIAVSNMWKVLLEEQGFEVTLTMSEKAPIWTGIANDDLDLALEIWLPTTDQHLYEDFKGDIHLHDETWFSGTGLGLVVPEYMDIDSIEELNDNVDLFDGEIVGIDAGASLTGLSEEAIEEYELDYNLLVSSEPAMISELDSAYQAEEPVVVTLWNPHWTFSDYDLKYLEDPKNVFGEPEDIYYMSRQGFEDEHPEVIEWLNNWYMDDETLGDLMSVINDLDDEEEGAQQWVEDNRDLVDEWIQ